MYDATGQGRSKLAILHHAPLFGPLQTSDELIPAPLTESIITRRFASE